MDPFNLVTACYGEAAAQVESKPTDVEAAKATTLYRSLAQRIGAERKLGESGVEAILNATRAAALAPGLDYSPGLARCMTLYREQIAKTSKAPD